MKEFFLTGTYSEPILFGTGELFTGKGEGIYLCSFEDGAIEILDCLRLGNPSFLTIDEQTNHIYAVNEMKEFHGEKGGGLTDIVFDGQGKMTVLHSYPTCGGDPCHVAVSNDHRYVCVANFQDGKVTVFPLSEEGELLPGKKVYEHTGKSIHPLRQRGPHAHSILFDLNGNMFVPDLGIDQLMYYQKIEDGFFPDNSKSVRLAPGSGPRSGEWSKDGRHFYLINELSSSITHMTYNDHSMIPQETVTTLPADFKGDNICADLHLTPDSRYLYASNRGNDTIAIFQVSDNGSLSSIGWTPCGGRTPRNFAITPSGHFLLVGNQDSDCIAIFQINPDGNLQLISKKPFPTPVCIKFFIQSSFTF